MMIFSVIYIFVCGSLVSFLAYMVGLFKGSEKMDELARVYDEAMEAKDDLIESYDDVRQMLGLTEPHKRSTRFH